jgi:hypothetical protein
MARKCYLYRRSIGTFRAINNVARRLYPHTTHRSGTLFRYWANNEVREYPIIEAFEKGLYVGTEIRIFALYP